MRKIITVIALIYFNSTLSQSLSGIENFILASQQDQNLLSKKYFKPLFNSMQVSMGEGWTKSAKTHKKFGFDISLFVSAINIPESDKSFNMTGFSNLTSSSETNPTIFGDDTSSIFDVEYQPEGENYSVSTSFDAPDGFGSKLKEGRVLLPNLQLTLGVPFKTDLIFRYMPKINSDGARFESLGFGIKHNILQHFKITKTLPLNLSALITYSKLEGAYNIGQNSEIDGSSQFANMDVNNTSFGLVGSVDLKIISLYGSISQVYSKSRFDISGNYVLNYEINNDSGQVYQVELVDPVSINNKLNYLRKNIGLLFNFPVVKLFVDYSSMKYNSINAGLSLSIR